MFCFPVAIPLSDRRLIFITGKGGVGKSTVALALGLTAARRGLRTIVAELARGDGRESVFGPAGNGDSGERRLAPNLSAISIDPQLVMEQYLGLKLPGPLASRLGHSRLLGALSVATPGLRELLAIGKAWELSQPERSISGTDPYQLVIVDAPASGHGIGVLRAPKTFAALAKVGPIAHASEKIAATLADRDFTSILAVTTAEEMPINETLELDAALERDGLVLDAVIVNALLDQRFTTDDDERLAMASGPDSATGNDSQTGIAVAAAIACARAEHRRALGQTAQRLRLGPRLLQRTFDLPMIYGPELPREAIERLATILDEVSA